MAPMHAAPRPRSLLLVLPLILVFSLLSTAGGAMAEPTEGSGDAEERLVTPGPPDTYVALLEADSFEDGVTLEIDHHIDVAHWHGPTGDSGVQLSAFVTAEELELVESLGVEVLETEQIPDPEVHADQWRGEIDPAELEEARERADREADELNERLFGDAGASGPAEQVPPPVDDVEHMSVLRVDTFANYAGELLSVEVRSLLLDHDDEIEERPERIEISYQDGAETVTRDLDVFNDAGKYIYHRLPRPVGVQYMPDEVEIRLYELFDDDEEELVEEVTVATDHWAPYGGIGYPEGFQRAFVPGYMDSVDSEEMVHELAEEFPDLAEVIELPHETNGYQRRAMAMYADDENDGTPESSVVNVESHDWGHEGGNDLTFEIVADGPDQDLGVEVADSTDIVVTAATDGDGEATSTAAEVVGAINDHEDVAALVTAFTHRGSDGDGVVEILGQHELSDYLSAPEDRIERGPNTVYGLRIGAERDGSNTGVFAYSQEHAREWVTPVVAIETASRLLYNYGDDEETTDLVDNLDIFIIPTMNPDGTDFSRYDNQVQRRNMTNHCDEEFSDLNARNAWGVDLNRNFREYNLEQGYSGASDECISDVFAGPEPLSEPEAENAAWVVDEHPNIRFSMNIHTHGGYFMWAPGSYIAEGRVPAPRPELGIEDYFFDASETILGRIAEHRGTVIEPGRTGPIIDVLYSAAGNSADDFYYGGLEEGRPVFGWSFEAGANRFIGGEWQGVNGFFPDYTQEGFDQAMEFSSGIYGMLDVAYQFEMDEQAPTTEANVTDDVNYDGPADVFFTSDEPATIHYTLDGSDPTLESDTVQRRDARDSAAPIHIEETTTLKWFGVDAADNAEEINELTIHINEDPDVDPEVESVVVEPEQATIAVGDSEQLTATAVYDDGESVDVSDEAQWSSQDTDVATVDAGVVTGVAEGDTDVSASFEGESGSAAVAVTEEDDDEDEDDPEPGPVGLERISAEPGRVEVAIAASQHRFNDGEADAVVLARADEYPDALAGTTLAAQHDAPLLLTSSDQLLDNVAGEIARALGDDGAVYLTGGTEALDDTVEQAVDGLGYDSTRLGGHTRFETAGLIADALGERSQVLVTTGLDFPDALTAGAAASANDGVVLLSAGEDAHDVVDGYLDGFDGDMTAVGGPATRAYPDAEPVMGATRDETAVAVAEAFFDQPVAFGVSRRDDYPDALSGGAHIAAYGGPLLLAYTDDVPDETADWLQATDATGGFVYGGTAAIDEDTFDQIEDLADFDHNDNDEDDNEE